MPLTIVVKVPLIQRTLPIAAEWSTNTGATISTGFASISAILVYDEGQTGQ